jgi:dTMP kinase
MTSRGLFITFEGGEGCGKTTQIQILADRIKNLTSASFVVTREPGGVPAAELIRSLLLNGDAERWRPTTEGLLMSAARHEHVEQIIRPALARNELVISDRFVDSTIVYQGIVGGVSAADIAAISKIACGDIYPDVTIILDIETQIGLARAKSRGAAGEGRFEAKGHAYHEKVRTAFLEIAISAPSRCVVINADRMPDEIAADIWRVVRPQLLTRNLIGNE